MAKKGGDVAKDARLSLEKGTGKQIVTSLNAKKAISIEKKKDK